MKCKKGKKNRKKGKCGKKRKRRCEAGKKWCKIPKKCISKSKTCQVKFNFFKIKTLLFVGGIQYLCIEYVNIKKKTYIYSLIFYPRKSRPAAVRKRLGNVLGKV